MAAALALGLFLAGVGFYRAGTFMHEIIHMPRGVLAHSTHVRGTGTFENGVERPRIEVVLATGIPEDVCRRINLGFMDPAQIRIEDYRHKEGEGILLVEHAGEMLYKLK